MTKGPEQRTLATVYFQGLRWILAEVKGQCLFLLAFPPFERQTFKGIFVRSLADCRGNGTETSLTTTRNKEYTLGSISLEKSQMDGSGTNQQSQQFLRSRAI